MAIEHIPELQLLADVIDNVNGIAGAAVIYRFGGAAAVDEPDDVDGRYWFGEPGQDVASEGTYYKTKRGLINRVVRYLEGKK